LEALSVPDALGVFAFLEQSQWWTPEKMRACQAQNLRELTQHARATTRYGQDHCADFGDARTPFDWAAWARQPILTREDVATRYADFLSNRPPAGHGPFSEVRSSGSTGHPVRVRTTRLVNDMARAANWRAHRWAGIDWGQTLFGVMGERPGLEVGAVLGPWGPKSDPQSARGRLVYCPYEEDDTRLLTALRKSRASYLATTPHHAVHLCEVAVAKGIEIRLDTVMARGATVTDAVRQQLAAVFGARVFEQYSSKEGGVMAHPCPEGGGYHVASDCLLMEIVDDAGQPVAEGVEGRVVITPFGSTAMPLIRYDQGDRAVQGGGCTCGRGLGHIHSLAGRTRSFLRHVTGEERRITFDDVAFYRLLGAGQIQVAQVGPTEYEIRYTRHDWGVVPNPDAFLQQARPQFFDDVAIRLKAVDRAALNASGKWRDTVVEWS
jgi:phenylacetate-CoA ligase